MEDHLKKRPKKDIFSKKIVKSLRTKAIKKLKSKFLPDANIIKIVLIGSSVKNCFGRYKSPGFRGSLYSDFDFIIFVKDNYKIPKWLRKEPTGRPFPNNRLNLAYRNKRFIDRKYDLEVFFIREKVMNNKKIQKLGEKVGIPMVKSTKHKQQIIFESSSL
ncbi:MAG: hypothetical protein WC796_00010 [Candidatus Pacearchaeota archaeon]|jgi:hypothetical protein